MRKIELTNKDVEFKEMRFIASALSKDKGETREFKKYVYKNGSQFMATDGARLHVLNTDNNSFLSEDWIKDGYYEVLKNTAGCLIMIHTDIEPTYPDCKSLLQALDVIPEDAINGSFDQETGSSVTYTNITRKSENYFDFNLVNDVLKNGLTFKVWQTEVDEPLCFKNGFCSALVMPFRPKK